MYGHKKKDPVEEQNDRIIAEWVTPAAVAAVITIITYLALSK